MQGEMPAAKAIPALLATQLLAAEVYSHFLFLSSDDEAQLWKKMLFDELDHIRHLHQVFRCEIPQGLTFPDINVERMRNACLQITSGPDIFMLRIEGALRLECAELDYGLEGLVARRLEKSELLPGYPGDILEHLTYLIETASRYSQSPNIGRQIIRLKELLDTCLADGTRYYNDDKDRIFK